MTKSFAEDNCCSSLGNIERMAADQILSGLKHRQPLCDSIILRMDYIIKNGAETQNGLHLPNGQNATVSRVESVEGKLVSNQDICSLRRHVPKDIDPSLTPTKIGNTCPKFENTHICPHQVALLFKVGKEMHGFQLFHIKSISTPSAFAEVKSVLGCIVFVTSVSMSDTEVASTLGCQRWLLGRLKITRPSTNLRHPPELWRPCLGEHSRFSPQIQPGGGAGVGPGRFRVPTAGGSNCWDGHPKNMRVEGEGTVRLWNRTKPREKFRTHMIHISWNNGTPGNLGKSSSSNFFFKYQTEAAWWTSCGSKCTWVNLDFPHALHAVVALLLLNILFTGRFIASVLKGTEASLCHTLPCLLLYYLM